MSFLKYTLIILGICAMVLGCAPKRMPEEKGERVPLSQVLPVIATKYQGVRSLQAQVTAKLEVQQEVYLLQGILLYENPSSLRLQLAMRLGPTAGEVIYRDGLLMILVPSEGKLYQGRLQETREGEEALVLTMSFQDYQDTEHGSVPLRVCGETHDAGLRFELRLKDLKVNAPLPAGAFAPRTGGWEVHPLADLKELLYANWGETRP